MVKILYENHTKCPNCNVILEYNNDDIVVEFNEHGFRCPHCGGWVNVEDAIYRPVFPKTFFHFGDGAHIPDDTIQEWIDETIEALNKNDMKYGQTHFVASGDTIVIGIKIEDENKIVVAKDYWEDEYTR